MLLRDDETCISIDLFFPLVLFPSFLPQQPVYLPCLPALVSCFVSLLCFSILPLVLVVILSYIHIYTPVPTLALPKWVTLHLALFVTQILLSTQYGYLEDMATCEIWLPVRYSYL